MYERGYVFTRIGNGVMQQTRSVRIDLSKFKPSSENRRMLKKISGLGLETLPLPLKSYTFLIGKLAKDFYGTKFGPGIMSAQKIKEILTSPASNFNALMVFTDHSDTGPSPIGYSICYVAKTFFHYSYPFYDLARAPKE